MNETPRRQWWRLHGVTLAALLVLTSSLFVANMRTRPIPTTLDGQPARYWGHGWPAAFAISVDGTWPYPYRPDSLHNEWFNSKYAREFQRSLLVFDLEVSALLILGCAWVFETRCLRRGLVKRFSIKSVLAFTAWVGTCCLVTLRSTPIEEAFGAPFLIAYVAIGLAWIAFFDVLGVAWSRRTSRLRSTEASNSEYAPPDNQPLQSPSAFTGKLSRLDDV